MRGIFILVAIAVSACGRVSFEPIDATTDSVVADGSLDGDPTADATTDSVVPDAGPLAAFACTVDLSCAVGTELCCHDRAEATGSCIPPGTTCVTQAIECADAADCGGGPNVCCVRYGNSSGNLQDVRCQPHVSDCAGPSGQVFEIICDPAAVSPCPPGLSCSGVATYAPLGWRTCL